MSGIHSLFIIAFIAVLAPLLSRLPGLLQTPVVVLELVLGIAIGPSGLGWVARDGAIDLLGQFGLIFLFFQAGFEFAPGKIGVEPLRLGALAWLASLGLAGVFVGLLYAVGLLGAPLLVALVLPTTGFGILIPILRQSGDLDNDFGRYVLGAAAVGELGPMILASVALAHAHDHLHQTLLSMAFLAIAIGAIFFARSLRSEELSRMIARLMLDSSILPVRISLLVLLGLVSLANELGMELVLGAYAAGMMISMSTKVEILQYRLTSIGSGFAIPLFFVTTGVDFDLPALAASPASLARLVLFCLAFLLIRVVPARLYRRALPERNLLPLALLSSTTLPLVAAVTYLGVRTGHMAPQDAHALVGAAVITVAVFPPVAMALRSRPDGILAIAVSHAAEVASAQLGRFRAYISQKALGRR